MAIPGAPGPNEWCWSGVDLRLSYWAHRLGQMLPWLIISLDIFLNIGVLAGLGQGWGRVQPEASPPAPQQTRLGLQWRQSRERRTKSSQRRESFLHLSLTTKSILIWLLGTFDAIWGVSAYTLTQSLAHTNLQRPRASWLIISVDWMLLGHMRLLLPAQFDSVFPAESSRLTEHTCTRIRVRARIHTLSHTHRARRLLALI